MAEWAAPGVEWELAYSRAGSGPVGRCRGSALDINDAVARRSRLTASPTSWSFRSGSSVTISRCNGTSIVEAAATAAEVGLGFHRTADARVRIKRSRRDGARSSVQRADGPGVRPGVATVAAWPVTRRLPGGVLPAFLRRGTSLPWWSPEGDLLWTPSRGAGRGGSADRLPVAGSLAYPRPGVLGRTPELHRWSVDDLDDFWAVASNNG